MLGQDPIRKSSGMGRVWNRVIAGFILVMPIAITLGIATFLYRLLTDWAGVVLQWHVFKHKDIPGLETLIRLVSLVLLVCVLYLIGWGARFAIGKRAIVAAERWMLKIPMLNVVYSTIRHIIDAFTTRKKGMFREVVLFEYPRKGIYSIGFLTNDNEENWELSEKTGTHLLSVFLPTTPNPTSGFLLFIPKEDCVILDMGVAEAMRLVISGGTISPNQSLTMKPPETATVEISKTSQ